MTLDAVNLLAEIRRLGGDVQLVGRDKLKLVAPTSVLPELAKRVRAAKPMLLTALTDKCSQAQREGEGVLYPRRNSATVQRLTSPSGAISRDWCVQYREAFAYWSTFHPAGA